MRKALSFLRNLSMKYQLTLAVIFDFVLFTLFVGIGFSIISENYNQLLYKTIAENTTTSTQSISSQLKQIETLSTTITTDSVIQDLLSQITSPTIDFIDKSNYNSQLNNELFKNYSLFRSNTYTGVSYITLYNRAFTNCTNWALFRQESDATIEKAVLNSNNLAGSISWNYSSIEHSLLLTREIRKINNMELSHIGNIMISVNLDDIISKSLAYGYGGSTSMCMIIDTDNSIIYSSNELSAPNAALILRKTVKPYQIIKLNHKTYISTLGELPDYSYRYISILPIDSVTNAFHVIFLSSVVFVILGFIFLMIFSNVMIQQIMRQFHLLINKMNNFSNNEFTDIETSYDKDSNNELIQLHQHFDSMALKIQHLIEINYKDELLTKDAKLKTLEAQINPHFLYNTLESINWHAKASNDKEISLMVESLGTLLRTSLSNNGSLATVSRELELVNSYMTIQKIRYESQLSYITDIDESLLNYIFPPLTIQPLLENAIHYGLEENIDECNIILQIQSKDNLIYVSVKNDGSEFAPDLLSKLENKEIKPNNLGIGLLNIDQRIKILFGQEYGVTLYNDNGYAVATIIIPKQEEN